MKTSRRGFISIFGLTSLGIVSKLNESAEALDLTVNRFDDNTKVNLQNIDSIAIKIKEARISSNNIDYSKDAELSVYASIEDNSIGEIKSESIDIKSSGTELSNIMIPLNNSEQFDPSNYDNDTTSLDIDLRFEIDHPSINKTITEKVTYKLDISGSGDLVSHSHRNYKNFTKPSSESLSNTKIIDSTNIPVLTDYSGFDLVKELVSNGTTDNNSSYSIPSGVIDHSDLPFRYSSARDYRYISNTKESDAESISGSDLSTLTDYSGFDLVKELVSNGTTDNNSSYTIPPGVIDHSDLPFRYSSARDYRYISNTKESDAESISGSDLSTLTDYSGFDLVRELISNGTTDNNSSYSIPSGVIDHSDLPFRYSSARDYRYISNTKESDAESISGSDLSTLTDYSGFDLVKELISNGTFKDNTSYTIPPGVIDHSDLPFRYSSARGVKKISNKKPDNNKYHIS